MVRLSQIHSQKRRKEKERQNKNQTPERKVQAQRKRVYKSDYVDGQASSQPAGDQDLALVLGWDSSQDSRRKKATKHLRSGKTFQPTERANSRTQFETTTACYSYVAAFPHIVSQRRERRFFFSSYLTVSQASREIQLSQNHAPDLLSTESQTCLQTAQVEKWKSGSSNKHIYVIAELGFHEERKFINCIQNII